MPGIQGNRRRLERGQRGKQAARGLAQKHDQTNDHDECQHVPASDGIAQYDIGLEAFHRRILSGQATK